jgi:hypothetical protein
MYRPEILEGMNFVSHQRGENDCNWAADCRQCDYMGTCPKLKEAYNTVETMLVNQKLGKC